MDCSTITKGLIAAECGKTVAAGAEDDVVLVNFNDIDRNESAIAGNVITDIVLKAGKHGYAFSTYGKSMDDSGSTFTAGTYRNTVSQNVWLRIFVKNEDAKSFVNEFISGAKVIAILKNREVGPAAEVKYECYGWDNGLQLNEMSAPISMTDRVVYPLNIGSSDSAQEGSLPKSVYAGTEAATDAMIASLIAVNVPNNTNVKKEVKKPTEHQQ